MRVLPISRKRKHFPKDINLYKCVLKKNHTNYLLTTHVCINSQKISNALALELNYILCCIKKSY